MKMLPLEKGRVMNTQIVKQTIHELIDQIEDDELLTLYLKLLEREIRKEASNHDFFVIDDEALVARAKASLDSIRKGNVRDIKDFREEVEAWKNNKAI